MIASKQTRTHNQIGYLGVVGTNHNQIGFLRGSKSNKQIRFLWVVIKLKVNLGCLKATGPTNKLNTCGK